MEEKVFSMCESMINSRKGTKLVSTILKFDRSLSVEDLINDVYIHHHSKGIYPNNLTVMRFLQKFARDQFRLKRVDNRKKASDVDLLNIKENSFVWSHRDSTIDLSIAINGLTKREQRIIHMYFFDGFTYEEIGAIMGSTGEWIRVSLKKIMAELRTKLNISCEK